MWKVTGVLAAAVCAAAGFAAQGDVVTMKDGRTFEGRIVAEDASSVRIDAMISGIRATMNLERGEIDTVEKAEVDDSFFEAPEPPAAEHAEADRPGAYVVIPVKGELGTDVLAAGVSRALRQAAGEGVTRVVFEIDSTGGEPETAAELFRLLRQYDGRMTYHAIVDAALAEALVFVVWCDTVHLRSGGRVGAESVFAEPGEGGARHAAAEVAAILGETAAAHGKSDLIVRAMVDPSEVVVAWKGDGSKPEVARVLPEGVANEDVMFELDDETLLVLTAEDLAAWGLTQPFTGAAADLGEAIGVVGWEAAGAFGVEAMATAREQKAEREASVERSHEAEIKKLVERRDLVQRNIDRNLARADEWDPREGNIRTIQTRGLRRDDDSVKDSNRLTSTSRDVWKQRTDLSLSALRNARSGVIEMQKLDRKAEDLGLDRLYAADELSAMKNDIEVKIRLLLEYRGIKSR
ncbi:MAG: hypothetical protein AAF078_07450 [Planctomycetota bacterium]